ncbi:MAG: T9SS type A sorting domain-containing protein, partial [Bacteroidota bacterium]
NIIENPSSGYVESDLISGMGFFTFATDNANFSNNPLPVDLLSFTASVRGSEVLLEWITASETNNNFFTVERSRDGYNFEVIGYVQGAGTKSQTSYYQLFDEQPLTGISYYRLKQTDFDGSSEYFDMVAVQIRKATESLMLVYPNPVRHGLLNIQATNLVPWERASVTIVDIHGRMVMEQPVIADDNGVVMHQFNSLSGLQAGIYFVIVQSQAVRLTERIILR